jgi:hypothetical protein
MSHGQSSDPSPGPRLTSRRGAAFVYREPIRCTSSRHASSPLRKDAKPAIRATQCIPGCRPRRRKDADLQGAWRPPGATQTLRHLLNPHEHWGFGVQRTQICRAVAGPRARSAATRMNTGRGVLAIRTSEGVHTPVLPRESRHPRRHQELDADSFMVWVRTSSVGPDSTLTVGLKASASRAGPAPLCERR